MRWHGWVTRAVAGRCDSGIPPPVQLGLGMTPPRGLSRNPDEHVKKDQTSPGEMRRKGNPNCVLLRCTLNSAAMRMSHACMERI